MKTNGKMASNGKLEQFRKRLVARRAELAGNLEDVKFDTIAQMGRVAEEDQANLSHEEFISLQRNSMDYRALREVEQALERLRTGEYGTCQECGEPVSEKRLQAVPWARYCIRCQEQILEVGAATPAVAVEAG